jgi:hypothetical protein
MLRSHARAGQVGRTRAVGSRSRVAPPVVPVPFATRNTISCATLHLAKHDERFVLERSESFQSFRCKSLGQLCCRKLPSKARRLAGPQGSEVARSCRLRL